MFWLLILIDYNMLGANTDWLIRISSCQYVLFICFLLIYWLIIIYWVPKITNTDWLCFRGQFGTMGLDYIACYLVELQSISSVDANVRSLVTHFKALQSKMERLWWCGQPWTEIARALWTSYHSWEAHCLWQMCGHRQTYST